MTAHELKKICFRFRLPYEQFKESLYRMRQQPVFAHCVEGNLGRNKKSASPLYLMLLAALVHLGIAWYFDDCEDQNCIGQEAYRQLLHKSIEMEV